MNADTALVIMRHAAGDAGRPHVNGDAADKVLALATAFRKAGRPVISVRHADSDPASPLHPEGSGYPPMPCVEEQFGEAVFVKRRSSAFATTALAAHLRERGLSHLYLVGAVAGFCVNSTARTACDPGLRVTLVPDAVLGSDLPLVGLEARTAFDVTMGLLAADFAELRGSGAVLRGLG